MFRKSIDMRYFFFLNMLLVSSSLYAHNIRVSGTILDIETREPVSLVNIFTNDGRIGTVSTNSGTFSLNIPASKLNTYLYFSRIDYETDSILIIGTNMSTTVYLTPAITVLNEVFVMPDSTLLTLLRRAYLRIPENFPNQPTRYIGFYQESTSDEDGNLIKLVEAELAVFKESYIRRREAPGQIEILRSRIKQLQSTNVGFVGGAFLPIQDDIVLQRRSFIRPRFFRNYQYDFIGIKSWRGRDVYAIEFRPLNRDSVAVQGTMLIDRETLAYTSFEITTKNPDAARTLIGILRPTKSHTRVVYEQYNDGRWHLMQASRRSRHDNWRLRSPLYSSYDFITTQIQIDSVRPIPVERRLEFLDPIEAVAERFDPVGWTDSDILDGENIAQLGFQFSTDEAYSIFNQDVRFRRSFLEIVQHTLPRLIIGYGVRYNPNYELINYHSIIGYRLNERWSVQGQSAGDIFHSRVSFNEWSLGVEYRRNLNNAGRPLFLGTSLWFSHSNFQREGYDLIRKQAIVPQLSLYRRVSRFFTLELFADYPLVIHSNINTDRKQQPRIGINLHFF